MDPQNCHVLIERPGELPYLVEEDRDDLSHGRAGGGMTGVGGVRHVDGVDPGEQKNNHIKINEDIYLKIVKSRGSQNVSLVLWQSDRLSQ